MSQTSTLKGQCIVEFPGTRLLIFFGVGCVAVLKVVDASFDQWEVSVAWRLEMAVTIYLTAGASDAHFSPAVTIALWLSACFDKRKVIPFIVSQAADALCAVALVYGLYYNLFFDLGQTHHIARGSVESVGLAGTFSTYPNPHINFIQAFVVEMVITTILMGPILALTDDDNGIPHGPLTPLLIGLLIAAIGTSMGPLTDFTTNLARDFGPKASAWLAGWDNVTSTGGRDIPYLLVPLLGPIVDAIVGAPVRRKLIGRHSPCSTCAVEEKETTTPSE